MISAPRKCLPGQPFNKGYRIVKTGFDGRSDSLMVLETADFTLFQLVVTPVLMPFMAVENADFAAFKPVVTTDLMPFTTVLTAT
jgi:hypothetical protein